MHKRTINVSVQEYYTSKTILPKNLVGWMAVNSGTIDVYIYGFLLHPGDCFDMTRLPEDAIWETPIQLQIPTGGSIRLMCIYLKCKEEEK